MAVPRPVVWAGVTPGSSEQRSVQNPREEASSAQAREGRLYLLFLILVIAVYAVIGYGVYKVIEALA